MKRKPQAERAEGSRTDAEQEKHSREFHATRKAKKRRALQNKIRNEAEKDGKVTKTDGTYNPKKAVVAHKKAQSKGGSNNPDNTYITTAENNLETGTDTVGKKKKKGTKYA